MENIIFPCSLEEYTRKTLANHNEAYGRYTGHIQGLEKHTAESIKLNNVSSDTMATVLNELDTELANLRTLLTNATNKQDSNKLQMGLLEDTLRTKTDTKLNGFSGDVKVVAGAGIQITTDVNKKTIEIKNTKTSGGTIEVEKDRYLWYMDYTNIVNKTAIDICNMKKDMVVKANVGLRAYTGGVVVQTINANEPTKLLQDCSLRVDSEAVTKVMISRELV